MSDRASGDAGGPQPPLHGSDSRLRAILAAIPDLIFLLDREGTYLDYHAGGSKLYVPPEHFLGARFQEVLPSDAVAAIEPAFRHVAETGAPASAEFQLVVDGKTRYYETRLVPADANTVLSIVRDITDTKRAESELARSTHFVDRILATMPNIVFIMDLVERTVVYVNDRVGPVLGYTADEISAMGEQFLRSTMHPDDYRDYPAVLQSYARARDGDVLQRVMRFRHKNGEWRWIHRYAVVFTRDAEGKPRQMLGSAVDITALKQTEQRLQELSARLLNVQDDERRRIARELHDSIAQLLFGIITNVQQLQARTDLPADAVQRLVDTEWLCDEALKQARSISYLLHPPLLDEAGLVAALEWLVNGLRTRSGIDVELDASAAGSERLSLSLERDLFRIVQEGLGNVVRHSGSQRAVVRLERRDDVALVQVRDFGHGMPPAADAAAERPPSAGVGIAGMRERLRHIGGRLDIESGPGGTTLTATVPLNIASPTT